MRATVPPPKVLACRLPNPNAGLIRSNAGLAEQR